MKKLLYMFLVLFLASCGSDKTASNSTNSTIEVSSPRLSVQSVLTNMETGRFKEGELLVKFKSGIVGASSVRAHQSIGASVLKTYGLVPNLEHVKLPKGLSVRDAIINYMSRPDVEYAEPNYIRRSATTIASDLYFGQQWALRNTGSFASGTSGADMRVADAWDISRTTGSVIAVVDTGIDYNHVDLVGNIYTNPSENSNNSIDDDGNGKIDDWRGWNFVSNTNDPMDDNGHGTHVSGIIGAAGDNGIGVSGVIWRVKIMPLKILDANGEGTVSDSISAIQYAVSKGVRIINASYGGSDFSSPEFDAINAANSSGALLIAAAGNGGNDGLGDNNDHTPEYPASYALPNIVSVAATDQNDRRATFSNYGTTSVHVAAPGVYILSTIPQGTSFGMCTGSPYPGYDFCEGTSMAAPQVSGITGLLYSYYTNFTHAQIRATLLRYVDVLPTLQGWILTGGRVNAYKAVSSLLSPTALTAISTSPTTISLSWSDNATGEDGYRIERSTAGGPYVEIGPIGPNSSANASFTDSGLQPSTRYTYRVRAFNNIGESPLMSNEASTTTLAPEFVPASSGNGGGGGGCSIGARQNAASASGNVAVMLIPLVVVILMRRKKK
ncbi:MAG: S8 family serine peptidase [Nitrospirae bacterium]|nr:S8 family serine peptidase [Nitrospirota bacterium]